jgi:hypothetical protein
MATNSQKPTFSEPASKTRAGAARLVLGLLFGLLALLGAAQTQNYPTYGGNNQRQGQNGNPLNDNPAGAFLNWYYPGVSQALLETEQSNQASQNPPNSWLAPTLPNAAAGYFVAASTGNPVLNGIIGVGNTPPYNYAPCVPSDRNNVLAAESGTLQTFTWTFVPSANQLPSQPGDYRVEVWTPVGPTSDNSGNFTYPERYFVYKVTYGTAQQAIYIVDQQNSRGGFARLGGDSTVFHYDGVTPITVTLYNTVPRDGNGNLIGIGANVPSAFICYANAVRLETANQGTFNAAPVLGTNPDATDPFPTRLLAASNTIINNNGVAQYQGVLNSFPYNGNTANGVGNPYWSFSPANVNSSGYTYTFPSSAVSASGGWTTQTSPTPFYLGPSYFSTPLTASTATEQVVTYAPNLPSGYYTLSMWCPGTQTGLSFGTVLVNVTENGATTQYPVNLSQTNGYVQIGNRQFQNSSANPLVVQITNLDGSGSTLPPPAGTLAFANAVRFTGNLGLAINSTPVHATVNINLAGGGTALKAVNIVAAEDGHLYCLDAKGRGDGTTDVYWVYPSLPNSNVPNYIDPNQVDGSDGTVTNGVGTTIAEMPTGFNTTSALVQEVPTGSGHYFLYIGSTNGRIYCIDMSGRGDYVTGTRTPGTTHRVWSFPDDFPAPAKPSLLGQTSGSVTYNQNNAGPTIFVPTQQGRLYALDAVGNGSSPVTPHTTTSRWTYPALNVPALGAITTPAIDGPTGGKLSVYFGTTRLNNTSPGQLISLDAESGSLNWSVNQTLANGFVQTFDDFVAGPTTAFNGLVGDGNNYIFIGNQNRFFYAFNDSGQLMWQTDELNATISQPALFTNLNVFTNTAQSQTDLALAPTVVVPTDDGNFYGLYAKQSQTNRVGTKINWGYTADGDQILTPLASGHQFMYGTDNHGFLYAFAGTAGSGGGPGGFGPGAPVGVPNNPDTVTNFANAKIAILKQATYTALQTAIQNNTASYTTFTNASGFVTTPGNQPPAFDFGQTLYLLVYDFPYNSTNSGSKQAAAPATVNFTFSVEGVSQRPVPSESFGWATGATPGTNDGFALLPFTLQPNGSIALSPGNGRVSFSMSQISPSTGRVTNYVGNPLTQRKAFTIANPLGIALQYNSATGFGTQKYSLGADTNAFADPTSDQNAFNGTSLTSVAAGFVPAKLLASAGDILHGQTGSTGYAVYDRSLMALVNGPDIGGLSNIRVERDDLAWNNGYNAVINPLSGVNAIYGSSVLAGFEDYPVNFPNDSLDYPDIHKVSVTATKEPQGKTENPLFNGVTLEPPANVFVPGPSGNLTNKPAAGPRTPVPTPFETDVNVPLYQPANRTQLADSTNALLPGGYSGQFRVFVDSNNNGRLDVNNGRRETFRLFTLGTGVPADQRLVVITPSVDLGSLSSGTGILPGNGIGSGNVFSPWYLADLAGGSALQQASLYQPFRALNTGNVNLPDVRLAKQYLGANWSIYDTANDDLAALDGAVSLFSDLDPAFSLTSLSNLLPGGQILVQKSRTTEVSGTELLSNPKYKTNVNTGHTSNDVLVPGGSLPNAILATPASPRVGLTPPIGFPVGSYTSTLRLVAKNKNDLDILANDAYSDPTFTLSFNVTETRLTNSFSRNGVTNAGVQQHFGTGTTQFFTGTAPMADNLLTDANILGSSQLQYLDANIQPAGMRDAHGDLIVGWSSNRAAAGQAALTSPATSAFRLYFGSLLGTAPANVNINSSPLNDLAGFGAANGNQWFSVSNAYPAGPTITSSGSLNTLFGIGANERIIGSQSGEEDTVRFGNPAFPAMGQVNPLNPTNNFAEVFFAFTGSAQKQTPVGRGGVERLFFAALTPSPTGAPSVSTPVAIVDDAGISEGRPSIVQTSLGSASIFYTAGNSGHQHIALVDFISNGFTPSATVPLGNGFTSASDPSVSYRVVEPTTNAIPTLEMAFSGKLRGRSNSEIFLARLQADQNGLPTFQGTNAILNYFTTRSGEQLQATGNVGEFRTLGVNWNPAVKFDLQVASASGVPASILTPNVAPVQDPQTGIYRVSTTVGTAVVDPTVGTVRFVNSNLGPNVRLYATYQPQILRLSTSQSAGFTGPSLIFENHQVGSSNYNTSNFMINDRYWYQNGNHAVLTNPALRDARYVVTYNGGATGAGKSSRPFLQTYRLGIQLPGRIPTLANGDVDFSQFGVVAKGPIQVDSSNGRVYFTTQDEDSIVTVTYLGSTLPYQVNLITERNETPVPMDQPQQESGLFSVLDPFDPGNVANRRPPLFWMFWSSNRAGSSDIYFQTYAPALYPVVTTH